MGKHIRVKVLVDPDVQKKYEVRFPSQIEFYIVAHLNDPDGWSTKGYFFEPVDENPNELYVLQHLLQFQKNVGSPRTYPVRNFMGNICT